MQRPTEGNGPRRTIRIIETLAVSDAVLPPTVDRERPPSSAERPRPPQQNDETNPMLIWAKFIDHPVPADWCRLSPNLRNEPNVKLDRFYRLDRLVPGFRAHGKTARTNPILPDWRSTPSDHEREMTKRTQSCQTGSQLCGRHTIENATNEPIAGSGAAPRRTNPSPYGSSDARRTNPSPKEGRPPMNRRNEASGNLGKICRLSGAALIVARSTQATNEAIAGSEGRASARQRNKANGNLDRFCGMHGAGRGPAGSVAGRPAGPVRAGNASVLLAAPPLGCPRTRGESNGRFRGPHPAP
jgi:hypothetical protein